MGNQRNALLRMVSAFGIVVGIGVHVGVDNRCAVDNMRMGKESNICVITHKEDYETKRYYFLQGSHG